MRLVGATASGWLADRIGRKKPLMVSIAWYSACNFIAAFSPAFWFLFLFRALLSIGMGAEWPCGAALAMETWPIRSRSSLAMLRDALRIQKIIQVTKPTARIDITPPTVSWVVNDFAVSAVTNWSRPAFGFGGRSTDTYQLTRWTIALYG